MVVVLSAQGDTTDDLIAKAEEINPNASRREMDMLLACGEQQSIALMAMAIEKMGYPVVSLCGWQVGITTNSNHSDARIRRVDCDRVRQELDRKRIVLVAGFQGVDRSGDVTTLGRGGSDTTAVAMAVALQADLCQIFTDVEGVYTSDPRVVPEAKKLDEITLDMVIMAPEMVRVISADPKECKACELYLLTTHCTTNLDSSSFTELYADYDAGRFALLQSVQEEQQDGCVKDWAAMDVLEEEYGIDRYEAWYRDEYFENHFVISLEKLSLMLPPDFIEKSKSYN